MKQFAIKMKMKTSINLKCPGAIVGNDFSYQGASVADLYMKLESLYTTSRFWLGLQLCLTGGYSICGIPHLAVAYETNFPEQSKGNVFTLTFIADQITLMIVVDQIILASTHCSPV